MSTLINMTAAQMSALECAGVFDGNDPLAAFINGNKIAVTAKSRELINELSNHLDSIGHSKDVQYKEIRRWKRYDARILSTLFRKMGQALTRAPRY